MKPELEAPIMAEGFKQAMEKRLSQAMARRRRHIQNFIQPSRTSSKTTYYQY
jgi:ribosomal protein S3